MAQQAKERRTRHPVGRAGELLAALLLAASAAPVQAGGIKANGATNTQVSTAAGGRQQVTPAPMVGDVSYNAFSSFDVGKSGVDLLNAEVRARTIVAEVFSPLPSRIEGPVSIDGPRANFILANQNGIRVNGGSFVNFGSIALSTGAVSLSDQQLAPGLSQRYVGLATRQGDIRIEAGGLDVNVVRLELIAKSVGIDGPITNLYSSATATTRVVAGNADTQFDTAASPTDNLTPWAYHSKPAGGSTVQGIAVDLTANSKVTSGRIEILVLDQGAGVRNAGSLTAGASDFVLTSTGLIEQNGGQIQAAGKVRLSGSGLAQTAAHGKASLLAAGSNVRVDVTGDIRNTSGTIRGEARSSDDADTPYAVLLQAGGTIDHRSATGADLGVVFGANDDVGLFAKGGIVSANARVVSNGKLVAHSEGDVRVESLFTPGSGKAEWSSASLLRRKDGYAVELGSLVDPDHQGYWVAERDMDIRGRQVANVGANLFSNNGLLGITAEQTIHNEALLTGRFAYGRSCVLFICRRNAQTTETLVGGQLSGVTGIQLSAGQSIVNDGGNVLGIGQVSVAAPSIVARGKTLHQVIARADGVKAAFGDTWAGIYAVDQGGGFSSQQGRLILQGAARQERGSFAGAQGVDGAIEVIQTPQRDPVRLENHLGLFSW
ncbi:two-partner secretion domain-containing protein [Pseudorhodoferax sp.]|uniref:two-partner secretion domain-containing protein n=1 Tax=Pseudorhodoferax sp. TaxID=1993553 RepID=UPI002DD66D3D|nr:filamentous hemagglutinin N-terminal domain-containing protein [Pseudorhodoferax sp.]